MTKIEYDRKRSGLSADSASTQQMLTAENIDLRLLLTQLKASAEGLLAQAGIDAREREDTDKLQKLILEELHHRIKNTLATVTAIVSQSLRSVPNTQDAQHAIEGRLREKPTRTCSQSSVKPSKLLTIWMLQDSP